MYEFATGVINVWEKRLLGSLNQERMLKAPDRASAFMVLFDTDLNEYIASGSDKSIEDIFSQDLSALKKKLENILDDKGLLASFLLLKFDALNLKNSLKKQFFAGEARHLEPFGFSLGEDNFYVKKMAQEAGLSLRKLQQSGQEISSRLIEEEVDKAYFRIRLLMAKKEEILMEIARLEIDVANLRSLLAKNSQMFLAGGNLSVSQIKGLSQKKEEESSSNLKKFLETMELAFLLEGDQKEGEDILIERKLEGYIAKKIFQREKEKGSGIEKVLSFFQKKMNGYANIRLILFAKENGLGVEEIEKALLPIA